MLAFPAVEQEDFCQTVQQVALYQGLSVASPADQEAQALAPLAGLEALVPVSEVYSPASTLHKDHTEAV